jgi:H+/Cl- antiporter ClcA
MVRRRLLVEALVSSNRRLLAMVLVVGVGGGLAGAAFVGTIHLLQRALWPTHWDDLPHLFILIGVGVCVALLTRILGNPGDVELMVNNIHVMGGPSDVTDLRALIPVALLCISSGGAMGPEAPLVQTTGSLGAWLAGRWQLSQSDTRILTITGMAAGFTVLFGAPLGSAIFALEILHRRGLEYYEALLPAVLGSLSGYGVYVAITRAGLAPIWRFPPVGTLRGVDLLWALAAGVAGAVVSVGFTYLSSGLLWVFRRIPVMARPVIGGAVLGALAFWSPYALTFGESQINPLLARKALASIFIVALLAKLCGTAVTLSAGWRGGFIIPLFFMGVAAGRLFHVVAPSTNEVVMIAAFMAAINVGVTKTPLGSTLVVTEMAGLQILPTTLIAAVLALFLTSEVGLIHTQQERQSALAVEEDERNIGGHGAAQNGTDDGEGNR